MFNRELYRQYLNTQWLGQTLMYFDELPSTNSYMKELASGDLAHGAICLTDQQTRGRGQYERNWESEPSQNLTFTVALKPSARGRFHVLTLACAKAVVDLLQQDFALQACIKWPNDVLVDGKKIAGLLTETTFNGNSLDRLLVGIGINVNQQQFSEQLRDLAASLKILHGHTVERELLLANLLSRIEYEYSRWHRNKSALLKEINKNIIGYGKWIGISINGTLKKEKRKLIGVNEQGQLTVLTKEGSLERFSYEQVRIITD